MTFWTGFPPVSAYNDDVYSIDNSDPSSIKLKRECYPPFVQGCCPGGPTGACCSNSSGIRGVFSIPFSGQCKVGTHTLGSPGIPITRTTIYCFHPGVDVNTCCQEAWASGAFYWQHYIPPG